MKGHLLRKQILSEQNQSLVPGHMYDVFISYAVEDKRSIVYPIIEELRKQRLKYFLDSEAIEWGDSLTNMLSKGLSHSHYMLAIITSTYLQKSWTLTELNAVFTRQIASGTLTLLPVIAGTENQKEIILGQMPLLQDVKYLTWNNNPREIVLLIEKKLKGSSNRG